MEILRLTDCDLATAAQKAASVLMRGGVVLYPTDTLYGLAVDARNPAAIRLLKGLKARETRKPISVVVPHHDALEEYALMTDVARELARRHLPGALTIVLPGGSGISSDILLNGALGIRIPDDPFVRALSEVFGAPYTATSANMSGLPTPPTVEEILTQFGPQMRHIDLVIDAGPRAGGVPSTVVAIVDDRVHVLREGAISREAL